MNFEEAFKDELGKNAGAWDKVKGAASSSVEAVKGAAKSVAGKVAGGAGALAGRAAGASPSFKAGVAKGFQASLPKYSWQKTEQAVEPGTPGAVKTKVYAPALQKIVERLK